MVLVGGNSGIGKTSLVLEVHPRIIEKNGYFISGKFDQLRRDIPYASLIQAFRGLIRQLAGEDEQKLLYWKDRLLQSLNHNGQIIVDLIPEIEWIIGKQPHDSEIDPKENFNRFQFTFQNFISSFADKNHSLVIFLDDLQWVDLPSLQLI